MGSPGEGQQLGVLLYYKYVAIPDQQQIKDWFLSVCSPLSIVGRIRIAPHGINVTVGGTIASIETHINDADSHPLLKGCDFKFASCLVSNIHNVAAECGFKSLSVRLVQELVTFGLPPSLQPPISEAGKHLPAIEFHGWIQEAALLQNLLCFPSDVELGNGYLCSTVAHARQCPHLGKGGINMHRMGKEDTTSTGDRLDAIAKEDIKTRTCSKVVVLDARNIYETRIGRFFPPPGVGFLQPNIRQYSDLPAWIDSNVHHLHNKCILMYCTGGVRCEMASAYLKSKGRGFEDVYQLSGGIQRYLEAFPNGGFFKGKNFVFDYRIAVPSSSNEVVGLCMVCGAPFDDYSLRCRCSHCRMLILVCSFCKDTNMNLSCELCSANCKDIFLKQESASNDSASSDFSKHALARRARKELDVSSKIRGPTFTLHPEQVDQQGMLGRPKIKVLCLHGFRQNASNLKGRLAAFTKKLRHIADFVFVDAPHEVPFLYRPSSQEVHAQREDGMAGAGKRGETVLMAPQIRTKKYAWLISPEMMASQSKTSTESAAIQEEHSSLSADHKSKAATDHSSTTIVWDQMQYKLQTAGWTTSCSYLKKKISSLGPFDGILGFSQGAAIAASLCPFRKYVSLQEESIRFKFVILCSGFLSPAEEHQQWASSCFPQFDCPSLHIFGGVEGCDRQISTEASMQLASLFRSDCRYILQHNSGHIIPIQHEYMNQVKGFLEQFQ